MTSASHKTSGKLFWTIAAAMRENKRTKGGGRSRIVVVEK